MFPLNFLSCGLCFHGRSRLSEIHARAHNHSGTNGSTKSTEPTRGGTHSLLGKLFVYPVDTMWKIVTVRGSNGLERGKLREKRGKTGAEADWEICAPEFPGQKAKCQML